MSQLTNELHSDSSTMIHGYHVIMPTYGFWLPNDPRGSWSELVRKWELLRYGESTKSIERRELSDLTAEEKHLRKECRSSLRYPAVTLSGIQAQSVAHGFAAQVAKSNYTIWACSILPEHTHLVLARHRYRIEQVANLLKGAATKQLRIAGIHPLAEYESPRGNPPRMWAEHEWKVYLDTEEDIENAIRYVEENPLKEGKQRQAWSFVSPFEGIPCGGWHTYHSS